MRLPAWAALAIVAGAVLWVASGTWQIGAIAAAFIAGTGLIVSSRPAKRQHEARRPEGATMSSINEVNIKATNEGRIVELRIKGTTGGGRPFVLELPLKREDFTRMIEGLCADAGLPAPWK